MIKFAHKEMLPEIRALWKLCFGDGEGYLDYLLEALLLPENILVHQEDDGAVSAMLCVEEMAVVCRDGSEIPGAYIYAVATHPDERGRGLSTLLLEEAHALLAKRKLACSVLVPASESLFDFYGKRGYEPFTQIKKGKLSAFSIYPATGAGVLTSFGLERMGKLRASHFGDSRFYVKWDSRYLRAIGGEAKLSGGEVLHYACEGKAGFAVCYRDGAGGVVIKEAAIPGELMEPFLGALHTRMNADSYIVYLREDTQVEFTNTTLPFSMVRWYDRDKKEQALRQTGAPPYLTHVLD